MHFDSSPNLFSDANSPKTPDSPSTQTSSMKSSSDLFSVSSSHSLERMSSSAGLDIIGNRMKSITALQEHEIKFLDKKSTNIAARHNLIVVEYGKGSKQTKIGLHINRLQELGYTIERPPKELKAEIQKDLNEGRLFILQTPHGQKALRLPEDRDQFLSDLKISKHEYEDAVKEGNLHSLIHLKANQVMEEMRKNSQRSSEALTTQFYARFAGTNRENVDRLLKLGFTESELEKLTSHGGPQALIHVYHALQKVERIERRHVEAVIQSQNAAIDSLKRAVESVPGAIRAQHLEDAIIEFGKENAVNIIKTHNGTFKVSGSDEEYQLEEFSSEPTLRTLHFEQVYRTGNHRELAYFYLGEGDVHNALVNLPFDSRLRNEIELATQNPNTTAKRTLAKSLLKRGYKDAAIDWYKRAADLGDVKAKHALGLIFLKSSNVKDQRRAYDYLTQALRRNHFPTIELIRSAATSKTREDYLLIEYASELLRNNKPDERDIEWYVLLANVKAPIKQGNSGYITPLYSPRFGIEDRRLVAIKYLRMINTEKSAEALQRIKIEEDDEESEEEMLTQFIDNVESESHSESDDSTSEENSS